jgi:DNA polymerase III epsilon subunit-like protein
LGYWKNNREKLEKLLYNGYTMKKDPLVFISAFPTKTTEAISREIRRVRGTGKRIKESIPDNPRILILDIETSPMSIYAWHLFKNTLGPHQVEKNSAMLCWAAKWLNDSETFSERVTAEEALNRDEESILRGLWDLIDDADILVGHNILKFDLHRINGAFIMYQLPPPSPYQTIDTLRIARKQFGFASNKMDFLNSRLEITGKIETNFDLWKRCLKGGEEATVALEEMETYCRHDVTCSEELYVELRPWMNSHPNMGLYKGSLKSVCPACGGLNVVENGYYYTPAGKYQSYKCQDCGAVSRSRINSYDKLKRPSLLRSTAR